MNLKEQVKFCLTKHQESRNSDQKLINAVYVEFFNSHLFKTEKGYAVELLELYYLPNPSHIIRYRQKLNEQGLFKPTSEEVIKAIKQLQQVWHNEMQKSNPSGY